MIGDRNVSADVVIRELQATRWDSMGVSDPSPVSLSPILTLGRKEYLSIIVH